MSYQPLLIAPFQSGLQRYFKPFLIGDDAFEELSNAYTWRGVVKKRDGFDLLANSGRYVNNANTAFTISDITQAANAAVTTSANHNLSTGNIVTFQNAAGMTEINGLTTTITSTGATTFTCDMIDSSGFSAYTSGAQLFLPVQGLLNFQLPTVLDKQLIAFSRKKSYVFNNATGEFDLLSTYSSTAALTWSGTNMDFFTGVNHASALWVTNTVNTLHYYQSSSGTPGWNKQRPLVNATDRLTACKLVVSYKNRLVVLNTTEGAANTRFRQRARWSQIGTPYVPAAGGDPAVTAPSPFSTDANAWRDDIIGKGGFIDADVSESIIAAGVVNDTLIVFFERSTWRLRYTGNQVLPFLWERINVEYGADAPRSVIEVNNACFAFSRWGWVGANTNELARIDDQIIEEASQVASGTDAETLAMVAGINDLENQFMLWSYPKDLQSTATSLPSIDHPSNTQSLLYNYVDKSFAHYDYGFRCFGEYKTFSDTTWADLTQTWQSADFRWYNEQLTSDNPTILGGTQDGKVFTIFDTTGADTDDGDEISFDIWTKVFNPYLPQSRIVRLQYVDIYCTSTDFGEFSLEVFVDQNNSEPALTRVVSTALGSSVAKYTRVFLGVKGQFFQLHLYLSQSQLVDHNIASSPLEIQGLVLHVRPEGLIKERVRV